MTTLTKTTKKFAFAALLLLSLTACTGTTTPGGPDMVDYSYVPTTAAAADATPGIEAF